MRIELIQIKNYRQYAGTHEITFPIISDKDNYRNVTVIQGVNGSGKSNLLNSITWCLYGIETHSISPSLNLSEILNDKIRSEMLPGQSIDVTVQIRAIRDDGRRVVFNRIVNFYMDSSSLKHLDPEFNVLVESGRNFTPHPEPISEVNKALPQKVNSFFFFDGERLDDFFKQNSATTIRKAVLDVSQITILDLTLEHLDEVVSIVRKKIKHKDPKAIKAHQELIAAEKTRGKSRERMKELVLQIEENDEKKIEFWNRSNAQNREILIIQRKSYEKLQLDIKEYDSELADLKQNAVDLIITNGPAILCVDVIEPLYNTLETELKKGTIPGRLPSQLVKDLLETGICICGRDLSKDECKNELKNLLKEKEDEGILRDFFLLKYLIANMRETSSDFSQSVLGIRKKMRRLEKDVQTKRSKLREVSAKLDTLVEDSIDSRFSFTQLDDIGRDLEREKAVLEPLLEEAEKQYGKAKRAFDRAAKKDQADQNKQRKVDLGEEVIGHLTDIREKLVDETREILQNKTKKYFLKLIWKKETYVDIRISEEFKISVINNLGTDCLTMLSAGERQVLALSFLAALREVSGFDAPIVIDTPLGRISKKPKANIARLLPKFFGDSQVVLLVTDEEYTDKVRNLLSERVSIEYELDYNEKEMRTEVKHIVR